MSTLVTQKGQATIPKPIRDMLKLEAGSRVDFVPTADGVKLVKCGPVPEGDKAPSRFGVLRGSATVCMSTDEIMALTRGEA